mmetsp:Transcript_55568/g.98963  ORF Transcript_55568/g.98963 Transcript_55568/m.98963 type:complete len:260 (+) Transcript_55568:296-1075(+)
MASKKASQPKGSSPQAFPRISGKTDQPSTSAAPTPRKEQLWRSFGLRSTKLVSLPHLPSPELGTQSHSPKSRHHLKRTLGVCDVGRCSVSTMPRSVPSGNSSARNVSLRHAKLASTAFSETAFLTAPLPSRLVACQATQAAATQARLGTTTVKVFSKSALEPCSAMRNLGSKIFRAPASQSMRCQSHRSFMQGRARRGPSQIRSGCSLHPKAGSISKPHMFCNNSLGSSASFNSSSSQAENVRKKSHACSDLAAPATRP